MMYGGFDVFKTYLAVKNHFTSDYDYHKYGGRVTAKLESFTKRSDRYFFHKLSKDMLSEIYWIILLVILLLMAISGLVML